MKHQHPKTQHLNPYPSNWKNKPTKALRVPEIFLEQIEQYARVLDSENSGFEVVIELLETLSTEELGQLQLAINSLLGSQEEKTPLAQTEPALPVQLPPQSLQLQNTQALSDSEQLAYKTKFGFTPSSFQLTIINWILNGNGNGCCNAVAGAGKSTTLKLVARILAEHGFRPSQIKICVFGKANSLDLIAKFGKAWAGSISTLHSAGWKLIRSHLQIKVEEQISVTKNKYKWITQELGLIKGRKSRRSLLRDRKIIENSSDFLKLIDLVRLCDVPVTARTIKQLAKHYELEKIGKPAAVAHWIRECLKVGEQQAINKICFDYVEQVWLPGHWNLGEELTFTPYKFILLDECQDLNQAQLKLVQILTGETGRILSVGDPRQAVFGFAGADDNSYYNVVKATRAKELPLSICYRCPTSHIELVRKIFPDIPIQPAPEAKAGIIEQIGEDQIYKYLQKGDMVLGRKTAPLVSLCIRLIGRGQSAIVKGKNIGEALEKELEEITKLASYSWKYFSTTLEEYRLIKTGQYRGLDNEEQLIETINDKLNAIETIYQSNPQAKNIEDLKAEIAKLFSDNNAPITLSTCHRAKGLEAERIFVWQPEDLPLLWRNQQPWQLKQEYNLLYVTLTRSKFALYVCGDCEWYRGK